MSKNLTGILIVIVLIVGVLLFMHGYTEWQLCGKAKDKPQTLTCAKLIESGYGDNANLRVTNAVICGRQIVYEGGSDSGPWKRIWVPLVPADGEYMRQVQSIMKEGRTSDPVVPPPDRIGLILLSDKISNPRALAVLAADTTFDGIIINDLAPVGEEQKRLLSRGFPGTDFSRCYILDHERTPTSKAASLIMLGCGLACLLATIGAGLIALVIALVRGNLASVMSGGPLFSARTPRIPSMPDPLPPTAEEINPYAAHKDDR